MSKIIFLFIFLLFFTGCLIYVPVPSDEAPYSDDQYYQRTYYDDYGRDVSYFYDTLSPYGYWVRHASYGYVWLPRVDMYGWRPYTYGHWVWTDHGWLWVSRFQWGWIPFHYGRWGWDQSLGWFWVPGTDWAPAWVVWRSNYLYFGWAPLPPDIVYLRGRGIHSIPYSLHDHYWIFVSANYFYDDYLYLRVLPIERNRTIIGITSLRADIYERNGRIVNEGLRVGEVETVLKRRIDRINLEEAEDPGKTRVRDNSVRIYKPEIGDNTEVRPKMVFDQKTAQEKMMNYRKEWEEIQADDERQRSLDEKHKREMKLLEETQKRELEELQERWKNRKSVEAGEDEKDDSKSGYEGKIRELKKKHTLEKTSITSRHTTEKKKDMKKKDKKDDKK